MNQLKHLGSDAFIVLEDADLEGALKWALWAKMNNVGQCCIAAKRLIVVEPIADAFLAKFQTAMEALVPGDPMDAATTLAPLSTESALVKLLERVAQAIGAGATLVTGGQRIDRPGAYMQPTILTDIKPSNPAFREEFFGPVALMFRVKDEDEAVALANDSDYGLGGSIVAMASKKNAVPSHQNGIPMIAPACRIKPGKRRPSSNDRTVPDTARTANRIATPFIHILVRSR